MSGLPWFRIYWEARTDAKLRSLDDAEFRVWFNLLCMAAEQDEQRGSVDISDPFILAVEVANGDEELLSRTCHALSRLKIVTQRDVTLTFVHFEDRQYDKPSDRPEKTRERKRRSRAKDQPASRKPDMSRDVTRSHALDRDKDRDKERDIQPSVGAKPTEALPTHGPAQALVACWYERAGGTPTAYPKAAGQAQQLVKAGVDNNELMALYDYLEGDPFWDKGFDLGVAVSQLDKFRQGRNHRGRLRVAAIP